MAKFDQRYMAAIRQVILLLVAGDFLSVERLTGGMRLSGRMLQDAVSDYGRTLILPPDSEFWKIDAIEVIGAQRTTWSVNVPLWTEEGRSDLTLECTLIESDGSRIIIEIDNLHVL